MKARIPTAKTQRDDFNQLVKRNFNLYAERIFQCWAMAMNDAGDSTEKVSETARKAYKLMTEICEHRVSWKDMHDVIKDELGIEFIFNNIKFNPVDSKRVLDIIEHYKDGICTANVCIEEIEREVKNNTEPKTSTKPKAPTISEATSKLLAETLSETIENSIKRQIGREVKNNG